MKQKQHFENLDSLRTIACLFVFSEHVLWNAVKCLDTGNGWFSHMLYAIFGNGGLGVSVFFTLSGFLITYLILTEIEQKGKLNVKAFYVRRTLRIWPLYFALLTFVFFIFPFLQHMAGINVPNPAHKIYYFTFLGNFDVIELQRTGHESFLQSGITWSIAIEEQFYLLWPLLFYFLPKKAYPLIFIAVILVSLFFRYLYYDSPVLLYFHTLGVCADLAVGGMAAWLIIYSKSFFRFFAEMKKSYRMGIYIFGILYILFNEYVLDFAYATVFRRIIASSFFAFVILQQNFDTKSYIKLGKFRLLNYWGKYTYGLYLLHPIGVLVFDLIKSYFDLSIDGFWPGIAKAMAVLIFSCTLSYLSYHLLEKPFLKLKERFSVI